MPGTSCSSLVRPGFLPWPANPGWDPELPTPGPFLCLFPVSGDPSAHKFWDVLQEGDWGRQENKNTPRMCWESCCGSGNVPGLFPAPHSRCAGLWGCPWGTPALVLHLPLPKFSLCPKQLQRRDNTPGETEKKTLKIDLTPASPPWLPQSLINLHFPAGSVSQIPCAALPLPGAGSISEGWALHPDISRNLGILGCRANVWSPSNPPRGQRWNSALPFGLLSNFNLNLQTMKQRGFCFSLGLWWLWSSVFSYFQYLFIPHLFSIWDQGALQSQRIFGAGSFNPVFNDSNT